MNEYKISFSMFLMEDGKISTKNHFSNCRAIIKGNNFEEAVESGDMFKIEFFDLK